MTSAVFWKAALIAAACTLVQAVAWFALSLVALLAAVHVIKVNTDPEAIVGNYQTSILGQNLLQCYFPDDSLNFENKCCEDLVMPDDGMLGTSVVYMIMSIIWFCFAVMLIVDLLNEKKRATTLTQAWAGVTLCVCFLDFVVTILFGVDYALMTAKTDDRDQYVCDALDLASSGLLMSLAARGYVLWLLNLISAIWLLKATKSVSVSRHGSRASSNDSYYNDPVDAVAQESRSMVFHGGVDRPWAGTDPRSVSSQPPLGAWDQADSRSPGIGSQRGGLAQRMTQQPPAQSPGYRPPPQRGSMPPPTSPPSRPPKQAPIHSSGRFPDPDYDPRGGAGPAPRSVLKKPPPLSVPAPGLSNASPSAIDNWRQQVQQADNRWQRSGGNPSYYDNRGYDGGRTGF